MNVFGQFLRRTLISKNHSAYLFTYYHVRKNRSMEIFQKRKLCSHIDYAVLVTYNGGARNPKQSSLDERFEIFYVQNTMKVTCYTSVKYAFLFQVSQISNIIYDHYCSQVLVKESNSRFRTSILLWSAPNIVALSIILCFKEYCNFWQ